MSKQFDKQFKENAVQYYLAHKELGWNKCAENLGISRNAIRSWVKAAAENAGEVPIRGAGNYASDEEKENARLRKELRDTKDALEILKKPSAFWETDTGHLPRNRAGRRTVKGRGETPPECQRGAEDLRRFKERL